MADDIVFSGISGRSTNCDSVDELWDNLVNGVDNATKQLPQGHNDLSKFDTQFFGVVEHQANSPVPYLGMLTEVCYETICDAGNHNLQILNHN